MARKAEETRERILDAAEALFAKRGFDGVTVRQIMSEAGADVALAYYHFKSKRDLFDAVLLRRVGTLNDLRLKALEQVEQRHADDQPSVEEIIAAFTEPLLQILENDPDGYLNATTDGAPWRPTLPQRDGSVGDDFTMVDLLTIAGVDPDSRGQ